MSTPFKLITGNEFLTHRAPSSPTHSVASLSFTALTLLRDTTSTTARSLASPKYLIAEARERRMRRKRSDQVGGSEFGAGSWYKAMSRSKFVNNIEGGIITSFCCSAFVISVKGGRVRIGLIEKMNQVAQSSVLDPRGSCSTNWEALP